VRTLLASQIQELAHFDLKAMGSAVVFSILATMLAGMYPIWRAVHVRPAAYLKNG
jgi:putative ABC transport system permease protein